MKIDPENINYDRRRNEHMERMCTQIIKEARAEVFRMPEHQFIRECLPILAGEEGNEVDLTFWSFNVGHYKPIHVYRGNDFLFEVPPLFHKQRTQLSESDRDSVLEDMISCDNKIDTKPAEARKGIQRALASRMKGDDPQQVAIYAERINAILARYGKPLLTDKVGVGIDEQRAAEPESNFYDEDSLGEPLLD